MYPNTGKGIEEGGEKGRDVRMKLSSTKSSFTDHRFDRYKEETISYTPSNIHGTFSFSLDLLLNPASHSSSLFFASSSFSPICSP